MCLLFFFKNVCKINKRLKRSPTKTYFFKFYEMVHLIEKYISIKKAKSLKPKLIQHRDTEIYQTVFTTEPGRIRSPPTGCSAQSVLTSANCLSTRRVFATPQCHTANKWA